jgi:hypothetical protein
MLEVVMALDFVGIDPDTPENGCPAVFVEDELHEFWFQGPVATDPAELAKVAEHSPLRPGEAVVKIPDRMAAIIAEAVNGKYERGRRGPGEH